MSPEESKEIISGLLADTFLKKNKRLQDEHVNRLAGAAGGTVAWFPRAIPEKQGAHTRFAQRRLGLRHVVRRRAHST